MAKKTHIYLLPVYSNPDNLEDNRYERVHESKIKFSKDGFKVELSETNSLIEEHYSLNICSARYVVEGSMSTTERKEAMIHHHPHGHPWKHLQFKLSADHKVIRINIEPVDEDDYVKCIKGFMHISRDLIAREQEENEIETDLPEYFFNEKIEELGPCKTYLLGKIKTAYSKGNILDRDDKAVEQDQLTELKKEKQLLPFLEWD